jgi:DNA-directed RNA polymerase subunit E'/Rpb7
LNNVLHTLQHTLHKTNDSYQVRTVSDQRVCVRVCSVKNVALQRVPFGDGLYAQCTAVAVR